MDVRIGKLKLRDGVVLHYEHWEPKNPHSAILFVHGIGDHCGRYGPFVNTFTKKGYKVCLYDQRGHGKSEGKRSHIERFEQCFDDLKEYCLLSRQTTRLDIPWFLVGHSLGGQIVINFLARHPTLFKAACASSPNIEIALTMPKWREKLGQVVMGLWPTMKLTGLVNPQDLSHDPKMVKAFEKDPLVSPHVTLGGGDEIVKNLGQIFSLCTQIKTPLLMLHGSADRVCSPEGTKRFFNQLILAEKELKIYEEMYHELFNEIIKEQVFEDIHAWFTRFGALPSR